MFARHTTPCRTRRYLCTMQHARKEGGYIGPRVLQRMAIIALERSSRKSLQSHARMLLLPDSACWAETNRSQFGRNMHCLGVREAVAEASLVPGPCLR